MQNLDNVEASQMKRVLKRRLEIYKKHTVITTIVDYISTSSLHPKNINVWNVDGEVHTT